MRYLRQFAILLLGLVFFVSGLLKLIDPVGGALVVESYLSFFHLKFLSCLSSVFGTAFSLVEFAAGAALLSRVWLDVVKFVAAGLLAFFTLLTLILFIFQPSMDCGCFGEVVHLTHLQSLIKNIVLCLLWLLAFLPIKEEQATRPVKIFCFGFSVLTGVILGFYSVVSLPLVDFTPFRGGAEVQRPCIEGLDDGAEEDMAALQQPLTFFDVDWNYRDTLALSHRVLVFSAYNPSKLPAARWNSIAELCNHASSIGFESLVLLNADPDAAVSLVPVPSLLEYTYFADKRVLQSLNRSNGGLTYFNDGQLVKKWPSLDLPDIEEVSALTGEHPANTLIDADSRGQFAFQAILLGLLAIMLII